MQFTPRTEKEIAESQLWPKGEYDFEVIEASPAKSGPDSRNPGTPYIKLNKVRIFNGEGSQRFVSGLLHPAMEAQLRHFCVCGGLLSAYEAGSLEARDCVGVAGKLKLKVKEAQGNFPAKNEIADFCVPKDAGKIEEVSKPIQKPTTPTSQPIETGTDADDDVPF